MDFLRRLFGRDRESGSDIEPVEVPEPGAVVDAAEEAAGVADVAWHKVATDSGRSEYHGEVDGAVVATITKQPNGTSGADAWQWRLDAPGEPMLGHAPRLKDAKPAVALALARGHR